MDPLREPRRPYCATFHCALHGIHFLPRRAPLLVPTLGAHALSNDPLQADPPGDAPHDPLALEEQVCFGLSVAARTVVGAYRPLLEPLGLTHPQFLVMVALWQDGPLSVKELGDRLLLDSGTLSPLLKRLEATGLVRRDRATADERQVVVSMTEKGEALRRRAGAVNGDVLHRLGLDAEQLQTLQSMLGMIISSVTPVARRR